MKNHWNSTIKRKVDTGGFLSESKECKPPVYLLLELEGKDTPQSAQPAEGQVGGQSATGLAPGWLGRSLSFNTCLTLSPSPHLLISFCRGSRCGRVSATGALPCHTPVHVPGTHLPTGDAGQSKPTSKTEDCPQLFSVFLNSSFPTYSSF